MKDFRRDVIQEIRVNVTKYQVYRAKKTTMMLLQGKPEEQYAVLWDFCKGGEMD